MNSKYTIPFLMNQKLSNFNTKIWICCLVLFYSTLGFSQVCIRGQIVDSQKNEPIADVNIMQSAINGTSTDKTGNFELCNLTPGIVEITVSCIGYQTKIIHVEVLSSGNKSEVYLLEPVATNIDELVVTATRTENSKLNTASRINTVNSKVLSTMPLQVVDDALKYLPGINVNRSFGIFSTKGIISMRGMNGKEQGRVLVLMDDIPLNKSDGGTVDWNMIDLNSIQKIEVSKSAGSSLYGGNAMGGTVHIITKMPSEKLSLFANLEYGTFNTMGVKMGASKRVKFSSSGNSVYWMTNVFAKKSDGYITQSEADISSNPHIIKSNMKEVGINTKAGIVFKNNRTLEALFNYYNDKRGTGEKVYQPAGNTTDHDSYTAMINFKTNFHSVQLKSAVFILSEQYKKVNEYYKDDYTWYNVLSTRNDIGWYAVATRNFGRSHLSSVGIEIKNGSVNANDTYFTSTDIVYNQGAMLTFSGFLQDQIVLWEDKFRIIAGIRFDKSRFYDGSFYIESPSAETNFMKQYQSPSMPVQVNSALSPRISLQYKWHSNTRLFASYSKGFRSSVLDDLCRSGRIKGGFKIANPSLKPEYINTFEIGFDNSLFKKLNNSISIFYSRGNDFQYYVHNGQFIDMGFGDRPIFIRSNISNVEIYGTELEIKYDILPQLSLFANYSFTSSKIIKYSKITDNDTLDLAGKYFTDVPFSTFNSGATYTSRWYNASVFVHFNGEMYINDQNSYDAVFKSNKYPAYTTVDVKIWHEYKQKIRLSINIQNLLDKKFYDSKYAVCPGRFITTEISFKIK